MLSLAYASCIPFLSLEFGERTSSLSNIRFFFQKRVGKKSSLANDLLSETLLEAGLRPLTTFILALLWQASPQHCMLCV